MTPEQLRDTLLYSPRTDEMYASLPKDAVGLATRLFTTANEEAKRGRRLRRLALIAAFAWIIAFHHHNVIGLNLLLIVGAYEIAYGNAAKVRADLMDMQERERLRIDVDKYLRKTFPGYKPPKGKFTIFSVSPYSQEDAPHI